MVNACRNFVTMKKQKTIMIVAGDPSGDLHASRLMRSIKENMANVRFIGIGGERMQEEGLDSLVPIKEISVVGFWEVAKRYGYFRSLLKKCVELLSSESVDMFVPVDYPGFNIRLAQRAKELKISVFWYIAPQLWAWGKNRAHTLAKCIDTLMVVFPFEQSFFSKYGIKTVFVGHPLMDDPVFSDVQKKERVDHELRIALLPGSRRQEVKRNLPIMLDAAEIVNRTTVCKVMLAKSRELDYSLYGDIVKEHTSFDISIESDARLVMKNADIGIVKTGTSTLEASLCKLPFVMMYSTSLLSYVIGKFLVKLPFISLPNILLNKQVIEEFVQDDANPEALANAIMQLAANDTKKQLMLTEFENVRKMLGGKGASANAALIIAESLQ